MGKVSRASPMISHLLFVDDCLLFYKATSSETQVLKNVLVTYEQISGQAINYGKSSTFFSVNVDDVAKSELKHIFGIHQSLNSGRYWDFHLR